MKLVMLTFCPWLRWGCVLKGSHRPYWKGWMGPNWSGPGKQGRKVNKLMWWEVGNPQKIEVREGWEEGFVFQGWNLSRSIQENMCVSVWGQGSLPEARTRKTDKQQLLGEEGTIWWEDWGSAGQASQNHVITSIEVADRAQNVWPCSKLFCIKERRWSAW